MIADFIAGWPLFHTAWLTGWLLAALLALGGVLVVARDQIFIGAAVSQASVLGLALALRTGDLLGPDGPPWLRDDGFLAAMAVLSSALAALLTTRRGDDEGRSPESLTGWVWLLASSVAVLAVAHSPHGLEEVHRILSSSIVGATDRDVDVFTALLIGSAAVAAVAHRRLLLLAIDPVMAAAVGVRVGRWTLALSCWLGIVAGLAIRCAGVLFTFGCLVLPALVARHLCREVRPMLVVAPLVGLGAAGAGFVLAHHWDYPPAQMAVALLCGLAAVTAPVPALRRG